MKVLSTFFFFYYYYFFLWKLTLFFRQIMLFLVLNERNWTSLIRCITNVRIYSFILMFTSTANSKTSTISLTFPKTLQNVLRKIAAMILHTTSENLVILNYKRLKKKGKKSNTDYFVCHMVTQLLQNLNHRQNVNMIRESWIYFVDLHSWSTKWALFLDWRMNASVTSLREKFKFDFIWTWTVHLTRDILLASLFFFR